MDPHHVETIAERRIREAQERGELDNLPGAGKPLPSLDRPYHEDWWINGLIEREQLDLTGAMNPTMALRKEAHDMPATLRDVPREESVRAIVEDYNRRVKLDRLRPAAGPQMPPIAKVLDVEETVAVWREHRRHVEEQARARAEDERRGWEQAEAERRAAVWWRRLLRTYRG